MEEFGILVFGHTRPLFIADVLESLKKQGALSLVHVWLDGHQGVPETMRKVELVHRVVSNFDVAAVRAHNGALGFRKLVIQALRYAATNFDSFIVLEDDCFPTRNAVEVFRRELALVSDDPKIFSVYGHPFLVAGENETITRFQGWGWGTTRTKIEPILDRLIDCYSLTEQRYLEFVESVLSDEIRAQLDITPQRQPTDTLTKFFAWDETIALLTALSGLVHKKTEERTIYNFGASGDSSRFKNPDWYLHPPFNMVPHADVWKYF